MRRFLTRLPSQVGIAVAVAAMAGFAAWYNQVSGADVSSLDRSTFIALFAGFTSILAFFCSISFAFVLFVSQSNRTERASLFENYKARLLEAQSWLLSQEKTDDREICLSLVFELDKYDISDLPRTDLGDEYRAYAAALETALNSDDPHRKTFFLTSSMYLGYIEQLLNRISLVSIRQIVAKRFIDTLAKGIGVICVSVLTLVTSAIWYSEATQPWLMSVGAFCAIGAMLLLVEFCHDLYRDYDKELDFIDRAT